MGNRKLVITLIIIIAILIVALAGAIIYIVIDKKETSNDKKNIQNNVEEKIEDDDFMNDIGDTMGDFEIETFNSTFIPYEGTECSGSEIKALFTRVQMNNSSSEHIVELNSNGITEKEQVANDKQYSVELSYDDDGYVNEILITESSNSSTTGDNPSTSNDMDKAIFNAQFMTYLGKITGAQLNTLLNTIQTSNSANPEHQIALTSNNLQDLGGIIETDEYVITLTYDDNNYVSSINIDKNNV